MSVLRNPRHEAAAQELASLKSNEEAAIVAGYDRNGRSFKANARKFCQRKDIRARVNEIWSANAELAEINAAWCMRKLKRKAEFNVDDFLTAPNEAGVRFFDISKASRDQLESLSELTLEEYTEGKGDLATDVRRTKIKGSAMESLSLIARAVGLVGPDHETNVVANAIAGAVVRVPAVSSTAEEWASQFAPAKS